MGTKLSKRDLMSRHALGAGVGVGALGLLVQTRRASADVPFTTFAFSATGTPKARTMPDRLAWPTQRLRTRPINRHERKRSGELSSAKAGASCQGAGGREAQVAVR
jgi:hypothetical protein